MRSFSLLLVCLLPFLAFAAIDETHVAVLSAANFSTTLAANSNILIEFYAPWCGHCKSLAPEYAKAATQAFKDELPAKLAKVDCTVEKELCSQYEVRGFPTVKFFQKGKPSDYQNARTAEAILSFLRKQTGPAAVEVTSKNVDLFSTMDSVVVLGAFASKDSVEAKTFLELADAHRSEYQFGVTYANDVRAKYGISAPAALLVIAKFADTPANFVGDWTSDELLAFISQESFPVLAEIGPENYKKYMDRGLPLFWVFVAPADLPASASDPLTEVLVPVKEGAAAFKGHVSAVYLNGEKYARHVNQLGHTGALPGALLDDSVNKKKYKFDGELTKDNVATFLQSFVDKTLEPFLKSEEIPSEEEQAASPVKVIVGKTFESIVLDDSKDVFVEFYAPWCGHCKNLAPTYESLAQSFSANTDLVIAKMDATANDSPVDIEGFPTLILFPKDNKSSPVKYNGDRTFDDMKTFLNKNAKSIASIGDSDEAPHDEL